MLDAATLPPRGHNQPALAISLSEDSAELAKELTALAERANAWPKAKKIKTPEDLDTAGALVKDARGLTKQVESLRVAIKDPYLTAEREIDSFFTANFKERLKRIADTFQNLADEYQRAKAAEARAAAIAEANRLRAEEERRLDLQRKAEEAGRATHAASHAAKADEATAKREEQEAIAASSAADLTRTRTDSGVLATAKTEWAFIAFTDFQKVPLDVLRPYLKREDVEKAVRAAIKMGVHEIPGCRIEETTKAMFR